MKLFRFSLDKTVPAKLFHCPQCNKRTFKRYVDSITGLYCDDSVGRCNREVKCGYHYTPRQQYQDNPTASTLRSEYVPVFKTISSPQMKSNEYSQIPGNFLIQSERANKTLPNCFLDYLNQQFGEATISNVAQQFHIGTAKHWNGATVFWQVDKLGRTRTGKVMLFNRNTGKRIKTPYNHIAWVHSLLSKNGMIKNFTLNQCLFGEHQLIEYPHREIAIVESEKTAIIANLFLNGFTWMACGGLSNLSARLLEPIKRNRIVLYPDLGAYDKWQQKVVKLQSEGFQIIASRLLEDATFVTEQDRHDGLDIADYLIRITPIKRPLDRLIAMNPNVAQLISTFDLVAID